MLAKRHGVGGSHRDFLMSLMPQWARTSQGPYYTLFTVCRGTLTSVLAVRLVGKYVSQGLNSSVYDPLENEECCCFDQVDGDKGFQDCRRPDSYMPTS